MLISCGFERRRCACGEVFYARDYFITQCKDCYRLKFCDGPVAIHVTTHAKLDPNKARAFWIEYVAICRRYKMYVRTEHDGSNAIEQDVEASFVDGTLPSAIFSYLELLGFPQHCR